ncbi:MAG TPA: YihY/virulence factor BrkB family protein [Oleiagrimonas sp.]|nr:YihY/virulence factor BrkB family protein [Oleiagrimonas sp.]
MYKLRSNGEGTDRPQPRKPLWWRVTFGAVRGFFTDGALSLAASLAFYTLLSFAPLLVLVVWLSTTIGYDTRQMLLNQIADMAGPGARATAATIYDSARERPSLGSITGIASIVMSLIGATTVFAQLQTSLNRIWCIRSRPGHAVWGWLRQRILSIGVIAAIGFVLIVSLLASAALGLLLARSGSTWDVFNQAISALVMAGLFAVLFRYLPDARLPWRRVWWGGLITSILFTLGKWAIGLYLSSGSVGGAYGAASSLAVLLVWVYYSGAIFFFGAEVVHVWAGERDEGMHLQPHAETLE